MPSAKPPRIPSYRLHKPTGLAVVRLNDHDVYLGKHGTPESQQEYSRVIAEWIANLQQLGSQARATTGSGGQVTVSELFLNYWRFATTYYVKDGRPTGEQEPIRQAMKPLVRLYGPTNVRDFGPVALKAVRQEMVDSGLSRKVVNARVNRIRRMFKWGVENQIVAPTVLHGLQAVSPLKYGRCSARERTQGQLSCLHATIKRFMNPHEYPVGLEARLHRLKTDLILEARGLEAEYLGRGQNVHAAQVVIGIRRGKTI
jgi:hypothetical protein